MEHMAGQNKGRYSLVFHHVTEEELAWYQRFTAQHGGAFVPLSHKGAYRLELPPGTRRLPNQRSGLPLRESYLLVYPDGMYIVWYRRLIIDNKRYENMFLFSLHEVST